MNMVSFLRRLLPSWLGPRKLRTQTCTLKLPAELICLILENLPLESVISFALTCRYFYYHYLPTSPRCHLTGDARLILLRWIEKDCPILYMCFDCLSLHRWRYHGRDPCLYRPYKSCRKHYVATDDHYYTTVNHIFPSTSDYYTQKAYTWDYHLARLVMNRHFYGDSHGPDLKVLELETLNATGRLHKLHGVEEIQTWRANIIDNQLFMKGASTITQLGAEEGLRAFINAGGRSLAPLVCKHLSETSTREWQWGYPIPELWWDRGDTCLFKESCKNDIRTTSCRKCFVDYQVEITPSRDRPSQGSSVGSRGLFRNPVVGEREPTRNWTIIITRWYQLGDFRSSPDDPKWNNFAWTNPPCPRETLCRAGGIRHRWEIAMLKKQGVGPVSDEEAIKAEGRFPPLGTKQRDWRL